MIIRTHLATALGTGLGVAALATWAGYPVTLAAVPLGLAAWGAGGGPDIDAPPHPPVSGSCAAEAHGPVSHVVSHWVNRTHHGHRGYTHRYWYAALVGLAFGLLGLVYPVQATGIAVGYFMAMPLYCAMPGHVRGHLRKLGPLGFLGTERMAWAWAILLGVACAYLAPAERWIGAAVGIGWASHILADKAQSGWRWHRHKIGGWKLGGRIEHVVATSVLMAGACALAWQLDAFERVPEVLGSAPW